MIIQLKMKYLKISIIIFIICFIGIFSIIKIFPLQIALLKNGYNILNYDIYTIYDYEDNKKIILNAYKNDQVFNCIRVSIKSSKCSSFDEGKPSSKNKKYSTLIWPVAKNWNNNTNFPSHSKHKLFVIKKENKKYNFTFNNLPENIYYKFKESDDFYTIDIFDKVTNPNNEVYNIDISALISNI